MTPVSPEESTQCRQPARQDPLPDHGRRRSGLRLARHLQLSRQSGKWPERLSNGCCPLYGLAARSPGGRHFGCGGRMPLRDFPSPEGTAVGREWIAGQRGPNLHAGLDQLEQEAGSFGDAVDIGTIAAACACGYMDFRYAGDRWRDTRPNLAALGTRPSPAARRSRPRRRSRRRPDHTAKARTPLPTTPMRGYPVDGPEGDGLEPASNDRKRR